MSTKTNQDEASGMMVPRNTVLWFPKSPESPTLQEAEALLDAVSSRTSIARVVSSLTASKLTHDAELSNLWDYYELEIKTGRMKRDKIPAKECNQRCRHINFTYPSSVICRHPHQVGFAQRLIDLQYRYCKDCSIILPTSIIIELEQIRESRKERNKRKPPRTENMPLKCPCCSLKTAHINVLIRRTKMGRQLFKDEGY